MPDVFLPCLNKGDDDDDDKSPFYPEVDRVELRFFLSRGYFMTSSTGDENVSSFPASGQLSGGRLGVKDDSAQTQLQTIRDPVSQCA